MKGANEGSKDYEIERMLVKEMSRVLIHDTTIEIVPDRNRRRNSSPRPRLMAFDEPTGDEEVRICDICKLLAYSRYRVLDDNRTNGKERLVEALSLLMGTPSTMERIKSIELGYSGNSDVDITQQYQKTKNHISSPSIVTRSRARRITRSSASSTSSPSTIALTSSALLGDDSSTPGKGYTSPTRRKVGMRKKRLSGLLGMSGDGDDDSSSSGVGGHGGGSGGGMQYEKLNDEDGPTPCERTSSNNITLQPPLAPPFDQRAPRRFAPSGASNVHKPHYYDDGEVRTVSASPRMRVTPNRRRSETHDGDMDVNRNSIAEEISPVSFGGSDWMTLSTPHLSRSSRPSRHLMLYQRGMQSRQDRLNRLKKHKEDQDVKELASCTFKPRTRTSSTSTSSKRGHVDVPPTAVRDVVVNPRGYSEAVSRLQRGYRERQLMREVVENRDPDGTAMQQLIRNQKASDTLNGIESTPVVPRGNSRSLPRGKGSMGRRGRGRAMRRAPPDGDAPATSISPPTTERNNKRNPRTSSDCKMGRSSTPNSGRLNLKRDSPFTRLPSITKRNSHSRANRCRGSGGGGGGGGRTWDGEWIEVEVTRNSETGSGRRYVVGKLLIQEGQSSRAVHEAVMAFSQKHRLKTAETLELHKALKHKLDTEDYDDIPSQQINYDDHIHHSSPHGDNNTSRVMESPHRIVDSPGLCPPTTPLFPNTAAPIARPPRSSISQSKGRGGGADVENDCCELSFGSSSSVEDDDNLGHINDLNIRQSNSANEGN
ncbi:hypothetical protein FOL47_010695 [Perkinsus chesapeaki]|uniref:Uncharacterized protein n=1 Tax=Perkinsus chesapeaki TaxID=330153 RepID=A0A7J6MPA5_PERCH|nr:hypothetical protein FOL47_010695 [Perkinsus chesapeaki]